MFGANALSMLAVCRAFTYCLLSKIPSMPIKKPTRERQLNHKYDSCDPNN